MSIEILPDEVKIYILFFFNKEFIYRTLSILNKEFYKLSKSQTIFKELCNQEIKISYLKGRNWLKIQYKKLKCWKKVLLRINENEFFKDINFVAIQFLNKNFKRIGHILKIIKINNEGKEEKIEFYNEIKEDLEEKLDKVSNKFKLKSYSFELLTKERNNFEILIHFKNNFKNLIFLIMTNDHFIYSNFDACEIDQNCSICKIIYKYNNRFKNIKSKNKQIKDEIPELFDKLSLYINLRYKTKQNAMVFYSKIENKKKI